MLDAVQTRWVWPKAWDTQLYLQYLAPSLKVGHMTNRGPASKMLERTAKQRLQLTKHVAVAVTSGTAALHALVATHKMVGTNDLSRGVLISAFGFPPICQCNFSAVVRIADVDPKHGGPVLPNDGCIPSAICLVNPFGYRVDVEYYRRYCDEHAISLWMDNAAAPLHLLSDGRSVVDLADMAVVSLHETKPIGRGEGGLLLVLPEHEEIAHRAINFGYDASIPPLERPSSWHPEASNWRMSDLAAAAILMHWELNWDRITSFMVDHDDEIVDVGPFKRGQRGSMMSCLMEPRQDRPDFEVKYYYRPLASREEAPEAWRIYDSVQCRPFHPPGGPAPYS